MPNYEHDTLIKRIEKIDRPPDDNSVYAKWLAAEAHVELLRHNATEDELIVYACDEHSFVHTVAVSEDALDPLDVDDLLQWSGNPFDAYPASYTWGGGRDDVWIERCPAVDGSETLRKASPLILGREIPELPGKNTSYFEVTQEYSHLAEIHHYPDHHSYCRFDEQGDLEQVVTITSPSRDGLSLVTFKREPLEEYLAASHSALIRMFDFQLLRYGEFDAWPDTPENVVTDCSVFYRQKIDSGKASYTRGVQIIRPSRPRNAIFTTMKNGPSRNNQHVGFLAYDFRNHKLTNISTDPRATTNYFQAKDNSLPFELSPAFFKSEVLAKYKNDTDKYAIVNRSVYCRGAWRLRGYDVNDAGQIHVYICDLRKLPYSEQIYWRSFNETPKTGISERAWENDFEGRPVEPTDPLERTKGVLERWDTSKAPWWKLRNAGSIRRATTPRTGSVDEWAREVKNLSTLIIEGFEVKEIRAKLDERGIAWEQKDGSLLLLEKLLAGGTSGDDVQGLGGLKSVQRVRSKIDSHARGTEASNIATLAIREHGTFTAHFEHLCRTVELELNRIERVY